MAKRKRQDQSLQFCRNLEGDGIDWIGVNIELTEQKTRELYAFTQPISDGKALALTEDARQLVNRLLDMPGITFVGIGTYDIWIEVAPAFQIADDIIHTIQRAVFTRRELDIEDVDERPAMPSFDLSRNCIAVMDEAKISLTKTQ